MQLAGGFASRRSRRVSVTFSGTVPAYVSLEPAAKVEPAAREDMTFNYVIPLLAAGAVAAVLLPDASTCMGKRKKKDAEEEDDVYEVDHIVSRRLIKGSPEYLQGFSRRLESRLQASSTSCRCPSPCHRSGSDHPRCCIGSRKGGGFHELFRNANRPSDGHTGPSRRRRRNPLRRP